MPAAVLPNWGSVAPSVGIPTTRPAMSTSAPPELPGLIGALVWITFGSVTPPPSDSVRLSALMIPSVTLEARPRGLPIAITMSPTSSFDELANVAGQLAAVHLDDGEIVLRE